MTKRCVFCGREKSAVPALVANDEGLIICSLCLEDCLAIFCAEGVGITRFIIAQEDSSGNIQIKFPRPKKKISLEAVAESLSPATDLLSQVVSWIPFIDSPQKQIADLQNKIEIMKRKKAELKDQLKGVETRILLLLRKMQRIKDRQASQAV